MFTRRTLTAPLVDPSDVVEAESEAEGDSGVYAVLESLVPESQAALEVLGFEAQLLPRLPAPCCLVCRLVHTNDRVLLATAAEAVRADEEAFVGPELLALLTAAESDRGGPDDVARWWAHKLQDPTWRLTSIEALGGIARVVPQGWSVERWLRVLGLRLEEVRE